ncbi:MAG: DUF4290 domain-containing protein [Prevotellaceae bacterium]|nr:DUF4290 domain-containing protein [Candidatus Minthosoma equi]
MPEYGRGIQQMVSHCMTIADAKERLRCAKTIVSTMATMAPQTTDKDDFQKKLWNHLAAISQYKLDIDYPVEIERMNDEASRPDKIDYPQKRIRQRNYGAIVERFTEHLATMDNGHSRDTLAMKVANHMKRDLSNWSIDSMSDEKVADDLARYTNGKVQLDLKRQQLVSDGELLSNRISTSVKKKKKK